MDFTYNKSLVWVCVPVSRPLFHDFFLFAAFLPLTSLLYVWLLQPLGRRRPLGHFGDRRMPSNVWDFDCRTVQRNDGKLSAQETAKRFVVVSNGLQNECQPWRLIFGTGQSENVTSCRDSYLKNTTKKNTTYDYNVIVSTIELNDWCFSYMF